VNPAVERAAAGRVFGSLSKALPEGTQMTLDPYSPGSVVYSGYEQLGNGMKNAYGAGTQLLGDLIHNFIHRFE
jgi:hypothetical protein